MSTRVVYGNTHSRDGWPMVDQGSCTWVTVPGTAPPVRIQIQNGQPLEILRAWVADINAYVEHVQDEDTACWTPTNSVPTSNHLSGTAVDIDWGKHPFQVSYAGFSQAQIDTIRELLDYYEKCVWWGQDWSSPKDPMHFEMHDDTYQNPHTQDFIKRKIRADGYSTFRRDATPTTPPPTLSRADGYAVKIIEEGRRHGITVKGIQIALATGLVESNITVYANSKVPESMAIPHDAVGSDGYSVGIFQQQVRKGDTGQWWWGDAATCMDPTTSAGLFYNRLAKTPYNGDSKTPGGFAQQIQQSAFPDRYDQRFGEAVALYDRLADVSHIGSPPPTPPTTGGDDMAQVPQEQWDRVYRELTQKLPSRSPLRHLGEGPLDTVAGFVLNCDGSEHVEVTHLLASLGHPPSLALLREVAGADPNLYPDRQQDALMAQAILADISANPVQRTVVVDPPVVQYMPPAPVFPTPVIPMPEYAPPAPVPPVAQTPGQVIGAAFDALVALDLAADLPPEAKAPLDALISILQIRTTEGTKP